MLFLSSTKVAGGGPDGISSKVLEWFSKICPNLILEAINQQMLSGNSENKPVNERTIILYPNQVIGLTLKKLDLYLCLIHSIGLQTSG